MTTKKTAIVLIGFQNDYFNISGILNSVVQESLQTTRVLNNTINFLKSEEAEDFLIISTPILFTDDYSELKDPVGILKIVKDAGAFKGGTFGAESISELEQFGERIISIPGKQGLNAFVNTDLESVLKENDIERVMLAGCVCSICIDSTGRSAYDLGYEVVMLSDCISGRTVFEQSFYCEKIFPIYATVLNTKSIAQEFQINSNL